MRSRSRPKSALPNPIAGIRRNLLLLSAGKPTSTTAALVCVLSAHVELIEGRGEVIQPLAEIEWQGREVLTRRSLSAPTALVAEVSVAARSVGGRSISSTSAPATATTIKIAGTVSALMLSGELLELIGERQSSAR